MANALYDYGRELFAAGDISWTSSGGDTIRVFLVDGADYTPDLATHQFLDDVPVAGRIGNSGGTDRTDAEQLTLIDPTDGVCDASDATLTSVTGDEAEYILIFKDDGVADTSSPLIALIDTATGLPVTPNGGDITIQWDDAADKIFKL